MYRRRLSAIAIAIVAIVTACHNDPSDPSGQPEELTALPRALSASEVQVRNSANAFSFDLWSRLNSAQPGENVFVSPLSASFALGMTMNGAANQTLDEMRNALQFSGVSDHDVNEGYRSLIALLTSLDRAVTMQIANSIWYRNTFTFHQTFFDTTRVYFGADVTALDFANATSAMATINAWVNSRTNGRIPTIVDQISDASVMFLINAIYFKGNWRDKFDPDETRDDVFHRASGGTESARLMHRKDTMSYAETPAWQAVDLPYGNTAFTMTVVLPAAGTNIDAFAQSLTPQEWNALTSSLHPREIDLTLPKITISYERTLNDDLKALGMNIPFVGDAADFTRMSPAGNHLFISTVKQKAFVEVNEEGTEAAAATSVEIGVTSVPIIPEMHVDRPYMFVIRERLSGAILFMGKIVTVAS